MFSRKWSCLVLLHTDCFHRQREMGEECMQCNANVRSCVIPHHKERQKIHACYVCDHQGTERESACNMLLSMCSDISVCVLPSVKSKSSRITSLAARPNLTVADLLAELAQREAQIKVLKKELRSSSSSSSSAPTKGDHKDIFSPSSSSFSLSSPSHINTNSILLSSPVFGAKSGAGRSLAGGLMSGLGYGSGLGMASPRGGGALIGRDRERDRGKEKEKEREREREGDGVGARMKLAVLEAKLRNAELAVSKCMTEWDLKNEAIIL